MSSINSTGKPESLAQPPSKPKVFDSLKLPNYRWLWLGSMCSFFGIQMQQIAQAWLAYDLTHSALNLGIVTLAYGLPFIFITTFSGVVIDRFPKRNVIITSQLVLGIQALVIAVLISLGLIRFWHLVTASAITGIASSFNMPARQAVLPEIVPREKLYNAIALNMSGANLARVAGPSLAGALIGFVSTAGVFYFACGFFFIAVFTLGRLPVTGKIVTRSLKEMFTDLRLGLQYIRRNRDLQLLMLMEFFISFFGMSYNALMPVFAEIFHVEALGYGFLITSLGVGALLGSLFVAALGHFKKKGRYLLTAGTAFGLLLVLFANSHYITAGLNLAGLNFVLPLIVIFFVGLLSQSYTITSSTSMQMSVETPYLGRVMSAWYMMIGMYPFGCFLAGAEAQVWNAPVAITISGGVLASFMLIVALTSRRIRRLER